MEAIMVDTTTAAVKMDAHAPPQRKRSRSFDHAPPTIRTTTTNMVTSPHQDYNDHHHNSRNSSGSNSSGHNNQNSNTTIIITTSSDSKKRMRSSQDALIPFDKVNYSTDPYPAANVDGSIVSSGSGRGSSSDGVIVSMKDDRFSSGKILPQHSLSTIIIHPPSPARGKVQPLLELPPPSHHRVSLSPPPPPKQPELPLELLPSSSTPSTPTTTHSDFGHGGGGGTSTTGTSHPLASRRHDVVTHHSSSRQWRHWVWRMMIPISLLLLLLLRMRIVYWRDGLPLVTFQLQQEHRPIVAVSSSFPIPFHRSSFSSWFRWFRPTREYQPSKPTATTTTTLLSNRNVTITKPLTLRQVLHDDNIGFHLAMAPAFFGFYGYFGMLSAWYDERSIDDSSASSSPNIRSVAGASAGAMAAILIAAGIHPRDAMNFCANITVDQYADFPGLLALFRGNLFEQLLQDFLTSAQQPLPPNGMSSRLPILFLQDARIPVAVTAFDIQTMTTQVLVEGPMARAARASATFPGLFQPVGWNHPHDSATRTNGNTTIPQDFLLIDGGVWDMAGTMGLTRTMAQLTKQQQAQPQRVINLCVGPFQSMPGPNDFLHHPEVISISMMGLPQPGPWAMSNGPLAYDQARQAMRNALDIPLPRVEFDTINDKKQAKSNAISPHYQLVINV